MKRLKRPPHRHTRLRTPTRPRARPSVSWACEAAVFLVVHALSMWPPSSADRSAPLAAASSSSGPPQREREVSLKEVSSWGTSGPSTSLERSTVILADANRSAEQSINVGAEIMTTLEGQRNQLLSAREALDDSNMNLNNASQLIRKMMNRALRDKCFKIGLVLFLVACIVGLAVAKICMSTRCGY